MVYKKQNWFTLIEILIAIIIFGIWILTIVSLVIQNIWFVEKVRNKNISTFLSREWIEIAYNIKDTNLDRWVLRKCIALDSNYNCAENITLWWAYKVSLNNYSYYNITPSSRDYQDNLLYFHTWVLIDDLWNKLFTWLWYDHDSSWKKTIFSRYLYFTWVYLQWNWWIWDISKIMKVESHVIYKKWWNSDNVVLESFIWETR